MKSKLLSLSIIAILAAGCSQPDDESASTESFTDKAATAVTDMKDATKAAANVAMDKGKEISQTVTEKAESAAEEASGFVKKGSSKVVSVVEDAKEGISSTVESVKEKAGDMLSGSPTGDSVAAVKDKVDVMSSDTGSTTESMKETATSALTESSSAKAIAGSSTIATIMGSPKTAEKTTTTADLVTGESIYTAKCVACHGSGATGAPKLDDGSWAERKAQGTDVMVAHAIKGYRGTKGYMPAKGGFAALTDAEVEAAVAYMVSAAK